MHGEYGIKKIEFGPDYEKRLIEDMDEKYYSSDSSKKKDIYIIKKFGMGASEAIKLIEEYGSDLDALPGITQEDKDFFAELKSAISINEEDEKKIDELYSLMDKRHKPLEIFKLKERISRECAKTFFTTMNKTDKYVEQALTEQNPDLVQTVMVDGKPIKQIKLKGSFDIILHSTDSGFISEVEQQGEVDYTKVWASGKQNENHIISGVYLNNDFMGCPPVGENGVMYGFTKLNEQKIKLMGVSDINTYSTNFAYSSGDKKYMSAKTLPYSSRRVYSEIGIEREGVKPDYVIIFDDMSEEVKQNAYKAASQFDIPVLFVDKREIEKEQLSKLQDLNEQFKQTGDINVLRRLINVYETNVAGWLINRAGQDESFTASIDHSRFADDFSKMWEQIQEGIDAHIETISKGKNGQEDIKELTGLVDIVLSELDLYQHSQETKPITKTEASFDYKHILEKVNEGFERAGLSGLSVDTENIPTAEQYRITIKDIMGQALFGADRVATKDVEDAEKVMTEERSISEENIDIGE